MTFKNLYLHIPHATRSPFDRKDCGHKNDGMMGVLPKGAMMQFTKSLEFN